MTVISTIMSSYGTAHASDSLIAERLASGAYKYIEHTRSKIIPVLHFKGAMSYWGLAKHGRWSTHEFLRSSASRARDYQSAELFAHYVADALNIGLQRTGLLTDKRAGIGIHFTAYEHVNGYWIPELFIMTNWTDPSYTEVLLTGVAVTEKHIIP